MLNCLHIENIAVIEQADLELDNNFNVLTGETGAGKSIIIDSINAVLGARTSRELIRNGCDNACVVAEFTDIGTDALSAIAQAGYSADENGYVIIKRSLNIDGRSSFRINGQPATAAVVREIGRFLINIHGQHDNQALLQPENHCSYIDKIADNSALINEYYDEFKLLNSYRRELKSLEIDEDEKLRRIDLLTYQINELEQANVVIGEYEILKDKFKLAQNFEKNAQSLKNAENLIFGEENSGAAELLRTAVKSLQTVNIDKISEFSEKLSEITENLNDVGENLRQFIANELGTDYNINDIQDRIELLKRLMLKYGGSEEKMLEFLEKAKAELSAIQFSDKRAEELENLLLDSQQRLIDLGKAVTDSRIIASRGFENDVCEILKYLDMPDIVFKVDIQQGRYTKSGCDTVEFMISTNAGENVKPLAKVASGGELSRVMLAIKSVLADKDDVKTLIFDEIDTGISGRAASKVAFQLKKAAKQKQVICVTHLAQIAACADNHLLIEKSSEQGRTYTRVFSLDYNQRINEIARIMSGTDITEKMFNSAKELLDRSL